MYREPAITHREVLSEVGVVGSPGASTISPSRNLVWREKLYSYSFPWSMWHIWNVTVRVLLSRAVKGDYITVLSIEFYKISRPSYEFECSATIFLI